MKIYKSIYVQKINIIYFYCNLSSQIVMKLIKFSITKSLQLNKRFGESNKNEETIRGG